MNGSKSRLSSEAIYIGEESDVSRVGSGETPRLSEDSEDSEVSEVSEESGVSEDLIAYAGERGLV